MGPTQTLDSVIRPPTSATDGMRSSDWARSGSIAPIIRRLPVPSSSRLGDLTGPDPVVRIRAFASAQPPHDRANRRFTGHENNRYLLFSPHFPAPGPCLTRTTDTAAPFPRDVRIQASSRTINLQHHPQPPSKPGDRGGRRESVAGTGSMNGTERRPRQSISLPSACSASAIREKN